MSSYHLSQDTKKCIGCNACTIQCKSNKSLPVGPKISQVVPVGPKMIGGLPRAEYIFMPCFHCETPWCVSACPTGVDIRRGLQPECIGTAQCIDACDEVMDKVGYPRGLIRYDTQHGLEGKPKHVVRPRTLVYATLLALLVAGLAWTITHRDVVGAYGLRANCYVRKPIELGDMPL